MAKANPYLTMGGPADKPKRRKAINPDARQQQLISLAEDLAERQLLEGTASSQVIVHYLKMGTARYELEQEKIKRDIQLQEAKTTQIKSAEETRAMVEDAIRAMKRYSGNGEPDDYEREDY